MALVLIGLGLGRGVDGRERTLATFFGWDDPSASKAMHERQEVAVQNLTAHCMSSLGLDYTPVVVPPIQLPDASLDPVSFAARWGFGVSTTVESREWMPQPVRDQNSEFIDALPVAAQLRYRQALFGVAGSEDPRYGGGCTGWANANVYGLRERLFGEWHLTGPLAEMRSAINADERVANADQAWQSCVSPIGFEPIDRREYHATVQLAFITRLQEIMGPPPGRAEFDRQRLSSLQSEERRIATLVSECDRAFDLVSNEVSAIYEGEFIRSYRSELGQVRSRLDLFETILPKVQPTSSHQG